MDIRSLQQVIAVRKYGSFAKAADLLGVSQPNLSKTVARLEDELKLKIFDRTAKGSTLTPIGEMIVERADTVITETRDLARDASLLAGGETGIVRIGCTGGLQAPLLEPLVQGVAKRHPSLSIQAEVASSVRLLPLLEAREVDVVFCWRHAGRPQRLCRGVDRQHAGHIRGHPFASLGERAGHLHPALGAVQVRRFLFTRIE